MSEDVYQQGELFIQQLLIQERAEHRLEVIRDTHEELHEYHLKRQNSYSTILIPSPSGVGYYSTPVINGVIMNSYIPVLGIPSRR